MGTQEKPVKLKRVQTHWKSKSKNITLILGLQDV